MYKGDLHVHTKDDPEDIREIAEKRIGSNCAHNKMGDVLGFMLNRIGMEYVAITNHARDLSAMWLGEDFIEWLVESGVKREEALTVAKQVHEYGDNRLLSERRIINNYKAQYGDRVLRGVEANVLESGGLDSSLIKDGFYDFVVTSVHPWNYKKKPSAKTYQRLLVYGILHSKTNVIAHIGYGYKRIVHRLDWDLIAQACITNQTALEINIAWLFDLVERECLEGKKSKEIIAKVIKQFSKKVPVFSKPIFKILCGYFSQGLMLAINTDFHLLDRRFRLLKENNFKYWRVLKGLEKFMNDFFLTYGVKKVNIVNNMNRRRLQDFIDKNYKF